MTGTRVTATDLSTGESESIERARAEVDREALADAMIGSDALMPGVRAEAMVQGSSQRESFLMFADAVIDLLAARGDAAAPTVTAEDVEQAALSDRLMAMAEDAGVDASWIVRQVLAALGIEQP